MTDKIKVLMIGDSPTIDSGFGRVNRLVADYLFKQKDVDLQFIGWCYQGQKHDYPYIIHATDGFRDYYGVTVLSRVVDQWRPDVVYSLGDIRMVDWISKLKNRSSFKWLGYFPIDGLPIPPSWLDIIKNMDQPVVFSKFALDNLTKLLPDKSIKLIYHGVDTDIFKPVKDKYEHKRKYNLQNKFIIGTVGRNQPRKNIPALIRAFAEFSKDKPDAVLYLHTCMQEDIGWDLFEILRIYDLINSKKVLFTEGVTPNNGVPDSVLVEIYNLFDLFVLPTMAEGFGLPILEAQACGVPVLVTDYSSCTELVQGEDELVKYNGYITLREGVQHVIIDVDDMIDKMNRLYYDRSLLNSYAKKGREFALTMQWKSVLPLFYETIKILAARVEKEKY